MLQVNYSPLKNFGKSTVNELVPIMQADQIAIRLSAQLVSRGLDCRQQLQCRREQRGFLLVHGRAGAQDICAITVFRSPWLISPSFSLPLSSHIRRSGPNRCHGRT